MTPNQSIEFELTMVIVPDKKTGRYSAFFAQFPEAIAVGDDEKDAQNRLMNIFIVMMDDRKRDTLGQHIKDAEYISKPASLLLTNPLRKEH